MDENEQLFDVELMTLLISYEWSVAWMDGCMHGWMGGLNY